jgi:hypothetical protein
MREYTFLYKENSDDRDCVAYIELDDLKKRHLCIDGKFNIHGACYSSSLGGRYHNANYEDIKTILTKEEYGLLCNPDGTDLTSIIEKLESEENQALFEEVIEEEKEYLMDEYSLDEEDIETIFDNYGLDYRDRAVVGYVYKDAYDLGYEEAWSLGYVDNNDSIASRYFDFEAFGEDLKDDENYCELADGRIVSLMY